MKNSKFKSILKNKEVYFHILFWTIYFLCISINWKGNWFDRRLRPESISQFGLLIFPLFFYYNAYWLMPKYLYNRKWFMYAIITLFSIFGLEFFRIIIYIYFDDINQNFYLSFINEFKSNDNIIIGRLSPIFISLQISVIYRLTRDWLSRNLFFSSINEDLKVTALAWLFFLPFIIFQTFSRNDDYVLNVLFISSGTFLITIDVFFIIYVLLPDFLLKKRYLSFLIAFIATQFIITLIQHTVAGDKGMYGVNEGFLKVLTNKTTENIRIMAVLLGLLLSKKYYSSQNRLLKIEKEKNENELKWLKSQVNPHFLFNNLNALDTLIDRNSEQAKAYLHKLSSIYRYLLTTAEKDVVTLQEEWDFIDNYTYLLKQRYGNSYQFNKVNTLQNLNDYLIPPATLQNLVENAVKHNHGSITNPLVINIEVNSVNISVSHLKRLKIKVNNSLGKGLKNLVSRYRLLSNKKVEIIDSNSFSVILPQIKQLKK